jgi:lysophospholipase L1-like esterase
MRSKRLLFIVVSIGMGAATAVSVAALALAWRSSTRRVQRADSATLKTQLDRNPKALYVYDEATSYRLKPLYTGFRWGTGNSPHETNSRGFLGRAEIDPTPSVRKVVFLGDSVTYGDAVPFETVFVSVMQQMAGSEWQLVNTGTPGWSTHQELQFYDHYLRDVPWRAVVIVFCLNDLVEYEWIWGGERALQLSDEMTALGGLRELTAATAKGLELRALRTRFRRRPSTAVLAELNTATLRAWDRNDWRTYSDHTLGPWLANRGSMPVMIVMAPAREQLKALALGAARDQVLWPQQQMQTLCARTGVACVDPVDELRSAGTIAEAEQLFRDDLHFSELGHAALARILWPRLEALVAQR